MPTVEILTIGDEILSGDVLDTNTRYIAGHCHDLGLKVEYHTGVRDDPLAIAEALQRADARADIAFVTGGLGPTVDDITIESAVKAFGGETVEDVATITRMEALFKERNRPFTPNNRRQAMVPQGADVFANNAGVAPGVHCRFNRCDFYFFPGVPRELYCLFEEYVLPRLKAVAVPTARAFLRLFGATESQLDATLRPHLTGPMEMDGVRVGFRVSFPETFINLSCRDDDPARASKRVESARDKIENLVGRYVYARAPDVTLEMALVHALTAAGKTLAFAESCTGGHLADRITNVDGSSRVFLGGMVCYANAVKTRILGVPEEVIKTHGAVSEACVVAMSEGIKRATDADYCAAVTGIAGPAGVTPDKPAGTVHIAWNLDGRIESKKLLYPYPRALFKDIVAATVFKKILDAVDGSRGSRLKL